MISVFSPHAWGWSSRCLSARLRWKVLPTRVGMVRRTSPFHIRRLCSPHTRGDGPGRSAGITTRTTFSPHAWGWSELTFQRHGDQPVLPTRVGMVRVNGIGIKSGISSPHTRGDGPFMLRWPSPDLMFSPHAWGWSARAGDSEGANWFSPHAWGWSGRPPSWPCLLPVLPTRVGMVRSPARAQRISACSPHTRGDGPETRCPPPLPTAFSPHAWGWSVMPPSALEAITVLPTRVGMVRHLFALTVRYVRSPHTRGDGPDSEAYVALLEKFSPHAWGWSANLTTIPDTENVLPTRVGMVRSRHATRLTPMCSPHTRGDGPSALTRVSDAPEFSPHAWGWSGIPRRDGNRQLVLPTRVGMVRDTGRRAANNHRSPHTRGDGPPGRMWVIGAYPFSPHAWGWSGRELAMEAGRGVLPTRVGMVRLIHDGITGGLSSPHTRGDGPMEIIFSHMAMVFSPHAWGWSAGIRHVIRGHLVLPTRVGMVRATVLTRPRPRGSPHTRGDGPDKP